jgi:pyrimidine 5'-nucleotidase
MSLEYLIFDLDDTLYPPSTGIWDAIGDRINQFMLEQLKLSLPEVTQLRDELFNQYGTTLRGLQIVYGIDPYKYLSYVHDIPLDIYLQPNPALRRTLLNIAARKVIFTNSDQNHALRVLSQLGLSGVFERIIDVMDVAPYCKPQPEAYEKALQLIGNPDPSSCVVIEDSVRNITTANALGFHTVIVGKNNGSDPQASARIESMEDFPLLRETTFLTGIWR